MVSLKKIDCIITNMKNYDKVITNIFFNLTSATRCSKGSNQFSLHSQWLSKNVRTAPIAASAPLTLDLIRPEIYIYIWYHRWTSCLSCSTANSAFLSDFYIPTDLLSLLWFFMQPTSAYVSICVIASVFLQPPD